MILSPEVWLPKSVSIDKIYVALQSIVLHNAWWWLSGGHLAYQQNWESNLSAEGGREKEWA